MRQIFFILAILTTFSATAQINFGAGITYLERSNDIGLQAKGVMGFGEWAGAASFDYYLTDGVNFDINLDAQYNLFTIGNDTRINPMAGLNFLDRESKDGIDIGLNLGVFTFIPLTDKLNLYIEPKITYSNINSFVISSGILF